MEKAICFGAAGGARRLYSEIVEKYDVIAFTDNDARKWGNKIFDVPILSPEQCLELEYDAVIITSAPGVESIKKQCLELNIPERKIITSFVTAPLDSRRIFLEKLSLLQQEVDNNVEVAEAGVFEGDFARWINRYYLNRKLHLFDTFEGFVQKDIQEENGLSQAEAGDYANTTIEKVMEKMPYPDKVEIHKGYFPDTARDIKGKFCFVNLDMDLYEPTYQGLLFFENKMVSNGVILVHDYFAENFKGPKKAVDRFIQEKNGKYQIYPIGDGISIAVVGF